MDDFPVPGAVVFGAISSSAFWALLASLNDKIADNKIAVFYRGNVDGQAGCKYTTDYGVRQAGAVTKLHR